jgi:hypothetical protein
MRIIANILIVLIGVSCLLIESAEAAKSTKKVTKAVHRSSKPTVRTASKSTPKLVKSPVKVQSIKPAATSYQISSASAPKSFSPMAIKSKIDPEVVERRTRIDFEDLLIQGQLKKADTVYLFERGENQLRSLVKKKENFRQEIYDNYLN